MNLRAILLLPILLAIAAPVAAQQICPAGNPLIAPDSRYTITEPVAGERVVADAQTGLMWKQCSQGQAGAGCATGSATTMTWSSALTAANNDTWAGFTDWRLPNINELRSLIESGCFNPSINLTAFPATPVSWYWPSTTYAPNASYAWRVNFILGNLGAYYKTGYQRVRLVRGGQWLDPLNDDADLSELAVTGHALVPAFDAQTPDYAVTVGAAASVEISATASDSAATVAIDSQPAETGASTRTVALAYGPSPIDILVTAEDSTTTQTYTVTAYRANIVLDIGTLTQTYDGTQRIVTATTTTASLGHSLSYEGIVPAVYGPTATPPTDAGSYTVTATLDAPYSGNATGTLVVTPRGVAVTADAKTKVYGEADPALTYTFDPPLVVGDAFSGALARDPGENVGDYAITQGDLSAGGNYALSFVGAYFSITPATQILTFPTQDVPSRPLLPGGTFAIAPLATNEGPDSGQPIVYSSLASGVCTVDGTTVTMHAMGACELAADQAGDTNHIAAEQATQTVTITAPVTADLHVQVTVDRERALIGDVVAWSIVAGNAGPADVAGAHLIVAPSARLGGVVWECVAGTCPDPDQGEGSIDTALALPSGSAAHFDLFGTVLPAADGEDSYVPVPVGASIALPDGSSLSDPDGTNDADSDSVLVVPVGVFADGFEALPPEP
jgi:hypothetical protein